MKQEDQMVAAMIALFLSVEVKIACTKYICYHKLKVKEYFTLEDKWRNKDIWKKENGNWKLKVEISQLYFIK
jgi:hypothetical protein